MKVNEALFREFGVTGLVDPVVSFEGTEPRETAPERTTYNVHPDKDPCEAVIVLSIGQSVTPRGELEVKHFKESKYGTVTTMHVSAKNADDLRKKLYAMVDSMIGSYHDFTNGA